MRRAGAVLAALLVASRAAAQEAPLAADADSTGPASRLAGRARVALDAAARRIDGGRLNSVQLQAGAFPFLGERLQLGVAPSYGRTAGGPAPTFHSYGVQAIANYVLGDGPRWRGYVGGYGALDGATHLSSATQVGAQAGALYFLDPALALRGEVRYRTRTSGEGSGAGMRMAFVTLEPYLFGEADALPPGAAGLGMLDVSLFIYHARYPRVHDSGISATIAPYLSRWAQVGVHGTTFHSSAFGGGGAYEVRGFGRAYLPLSARTQPFVEGFAESSTFGGEEGGLTAYGGALGVRRMLNARVALDVGARRTLHPRETIGEGEFERPFRRSGNTSLVAALAMRLGRVR